MRKIEEGMVARTCTKQVTIMRGSSTHCVLLLRSRESFIGSDYTTLLFIQVELLSVHYASNKRNQGLYMYLQQHYAVQKLVPCTPVYYKGYSYIPEKQLSGTNSLTLEIPWDTSAIELPKLEPELHLRPSICDYCNCHSSHHANYL